MKYLMLCLAILICPACTTTTSVGSSGAELQALSNSKKLELTNKVISVNTKQKVINDAKVFTTTKDSLITDKGEIRFADIRGLAVKKVNVGKTVVATAGGLFAGGVVIAIALPAILFLAYITDGAR